MGKQDRFTDEFKQDAVAQVELLPKFWTDFRVI